MASLTPQGPNGPKSLLHVATVLAPRQTLPTGQSRDVPGESSEGLLNKTVHLRNQWLPHLQATFPVLYLYTTQIASQEWARAQHSLCFSLMYILFVFPETLHGWVV